MNKVTYNIITSLIAGALVFFGAFSDGNISYQGIIAAISASAIVALTKFRDWFSDNESYISKAFNFF